MIIQDLASFIEGNIVGKDSFLMMRDLQGDLHF